VLASALSVIILAIILSFYDDYRNKKKGFNDRTVWRELKQIKKRILNPYYGEQYVVSIEKIYRKIPDKSFSGSCNSDDCRYQEDSIHVLKNIDS